MIDTEVENILQEMRERVRAQEAGRQKTLPQVETNENAQGEPQDELLPRALPETLVHLAQQLVTTERAWDKLPPITSKRSGLAARMELWIKRQLKRATHWFTWEQKDFNKAVNAALHDIADALAIHEREATATRSNGFAFALSKKQFAASSCSKNTITNTPRLSKMENLYQRAGIQDVAEFYRTRFVSDELLDARYFNALNRYDMRWARTMWIYNNVRRGSSVLDLGCGGGILSLLKRKGVRVTGVDISTQCAATARRNGYDAAAVAQLAALPFADDSFDYVVSLDVMGHIMFEDKDAVLREIKRVLRPAGVTLHGIECLDRSKRKDYDEMSEEELRRYINVDGHVGMEDETEIASRFRRFFARVRTEPRFAICQPVEEFIKQADEYGRPFCEPDFLDYLRGLSFAERRAFNMAMGYVFDKISELEIKLPRSEYVFLKATDELPGSFYNEQRDRSDLLLAINGEMFTEPHARLDDSSRAMFDGGWYDAEVFPPVARWMAARASIRFAARSLSKLRFDLTTHIPDLDARPLQLDFYLNGARVSSVSLVRHGWLELEVDASAITRRSENVMDGETFEFEIRADRTWQPRPHALENRDDRELSIAVCNIEIFS